MFCLKVPTDPGWVVEAMRDVDAVLRDHAHCEMKAASNALSLAARHPRDVALLRALTDLAREEIDHFQQVLAILEERGIDLGSPPVDEYAAALRRASSSLPRDPAIPVVVDRLLVAALIEARSCERFKLLVDALAPLEGPNDLHALYKELFAAEARHYRTFVDLATAAADGDEARVTARLEALAEREGAIVQSLAQGATRATVHG